ncbi:choline transporter-like protein 1 [Garra rufa]|uniref:choline transporter-like protein 1 n=1 Tax=Garra rufa TaxID=137080 RepID=UPI003CCE949C
MGCCGSTQKTREWKPLEQRKCTDIPWLLLFILFNVGMLCICGFAIATGAASRLISGYDSYGNTCGQKNAKIPGIELSGRDHTSRKYVFFLDPCNIDILGRKIKSVALCVSKCPDAELKTYEDLTKFSAVNGSDLCSYDIQRDTYSTHPSRATKCPTLPVHPSASLPVFHRCMPVDISCYAKFAEAFITFISDNSVVHRVIAGVMTSKEIIMGLCLLALVLSLILMVVIRYISLVLVWILTAVVVAGSIGGTGILWWLYVDQSKSVNATLPAVELEVAKDNQKALLIYAIAATVFTVILLLLMFFMRKRVALTIALFHVAGKVFTYLPLLALQPFWTFLTLMLFWVYWITVLLFLGTNAYIATAINSTNFCTSARDAFFILAENALRVAAINSVGDFVLFLGKVLIVSCTAFAGVLSLNYQREYTVWVLPLIIVCLFAFLVAHCFLSIFEIVVDVLFLCFAIDTKYNDGSPGREYYMDKALMEFVENTRKATERYNKTEGESREMKSMTGGTLA